MPWLRQDRGRRPAHPADRHDRLCEALCEAHQLAQVTLQGSGGYGLHWLDLDLDLSVPGLLADLSGTSSHLARQAGRTTTPAKAAAARANGAKGGRPRRTA